MGNIYICLNVFCVKLNLWGLFIKFYFKFYNTIIVIDFINYTWF